jgi:hypothetical protein
MPIGRPPWLDSDRPYEEEGGAREVVVHVVVVTGRQCSTTMVTNGD